uniref:Pollen-specific protein C13 n=1 Tax=Anthurium amnicola TaxID=1678845 RepID=A0A1D1Y5W6_9ARAE
MCTRSRQDDCRRFLRPRCPAAVARHAITDAATTAVLSADSFFSSSFYTLPFISSNPASALNPQLFSLLSTLSTSPNPNSAEASQPIRSPTMASAAARLLLALAVCGLAALPHLVCGSRSLRSAFVVKGGVFCDTCRAGFETPASTYIPGAKVVVECRDRETGVKKCKSEGVTDGEGKYRIEVVGEHGNEICEAALVSSPLPGCATPLAGRDRARVLLSHHDGVASNERIANNLGYESDTVLQGCAQIMQVYQQYQD